LVNPLSCRANPHWRAKSSGVRQIKKVSRAHWGAWRLNGLKLTVQTRVLYREKEFCLLTVLRRQLIRGDLYYTRQRGYWRGTLILTENKIICMHFFVVIGSGWSQLAIQKKSSFRLIKSHCTLATLLCYSNTRQFYSSRGGERWHLRG
jgi:hypothetical protein